MIIQIRGTSGSGKSTAMRAVMDRIGGPWKPVKVDGRKRPLYYQLAKASPRILILGHYESACGGCDTIGSAAKVYDLTRELTRLTRPPFVILQEGLLLSEDVKWTLQMPDVHTLFLTTPLDRCLSQIKGRRAEAGNDKPLDESNTTHRVKVIERARRRLVEAGTVAVRRCSPEQAPRLVCSLVERAFR